MMISRKSLPRRTVLRGIGATLALPLLDGMVPALTALGRTAAKPVRRLGVVYVPNGIVMDKWIPATAGAGFEITPILQPLERFRDRLLVVSGLSNKGPDNIHETGATSFLTGVPPKRTQGSQLGAGVSMDQKVAREAGRHTQLASLELALESGDDVGTCGGGYTCAYTNTICWRSATTPLPMETNPRTVFERLLGDTGGTDPAARLARIEQNRSLLDAVTDKVDSLRRDLGPRDRHKLGEYLDAVRDIERRIEKAEAPRDSSPVTLTAGSPDRWAIAGRSTPAPVPQPRQSSLSPPRETDAVLCSDPEEDRRDEDRTEADAGRRPRHHGRCRNEGAGDRRRHGYRDHGRQRQSADVSSHGQRAHHQHRRGDQQGVHRGRGAALDARLRRGERTGGGRRSGFT